MRCGVFIHPIDYKLYKRKILGKFSWRMYYRPSVVSKREGGGTVRDDGKLQEFAYLYIYGWRAYVLPLHKDMYSAGDANQHPFFPWFGAGPEPWSWGQLL